MSEISFFVVGTCSDFRHTRWVAVCVCVCVSVCSIQLDPLHELPRQVVDRMLSVLPLHRRCLVTFLCVQPPPH